LHIITVPWLTVSLFLLSTTRVLYPWEADPHLSMVLLLPRGAPSALVIDISHPSHVCFLLSLPFPSARCGILIFLHDERNSPCRPFSVRGVMFRLLFPHGAGGTQKPIFFLLARSAAKDSDYFEPFLLGVPHPGKCPTNSP